MDNIITVASEQSLTDRKTILSEPPMEMAHKLYALRTVLKKMSLPLIYFINVFIKSEPQNLYSNMTF